MDAERFRLSKLRPRIGSDGVGDHGLAAEAHHDLQRRLRDVRLLLMTDRVRAANAVQARPTATMIVIIVAIVGKSSRPSRGRPTAYGGRMLIEVQVEHADLTEVVRGHFDLFEATRADFSLAESALVVPRENAETRLLARET